MVWLLAFSALRQRVLRTFLTALGIAVAVGSMVIFLSLGEGLRQAFVGQIGSIGPDLQVSFGPFDASASLTSLPELPLDYLKQLTEQKESYGITNIIPLLFHARAGFSPGSSFLFQGLPPGEDIGAIYYKYEILEGRSLMRADTEAKVAVIGEQVAQRSRLELGKVLRLNSRSIFEIVGIAKSEGGLIDNAILVPLKPLQEAIGIDDRVTFLALDLAEPGAAAATAERLGIDYPELGFQTRGDVLGVVEEGIRITDVVRLGISAIALIVGAIAVANTMIMSVIERTREFGVVRAIGAKPRFLFNLVLTEAVMLSVIGAFFGVILGRLGMIIVNNIANDLIGLDVAALTTRLVLFAIAVAIAMGLVSGLLPALRAARIPIAVAMARE